MTSSRIPLAIVGCGGMGGRHLLGLQELHETHLCNVELVAVCDLRRDNAEHLAGEAARLLGQRPQVFTDLAEMVASMPDLQAVDITTDAASHHIVACAAFDLGLHVLCEKPLALTVRGCNRILEAQRRSGKRLSVAENYRRDPMSRLTRALIDAGVIGSPHLFMDISASSGNRIIITPWRHMKEKGGMLLDGGVHNADMMLYTMGDVAQIYARIALWEKTRYKPTSRAGVSGFYERWYAEMPDEIEATAEDTLTSVIDFTSGAMGQWTQSYAAHGQGFGHKAIYGSAGSLIPGGTRNGVSPVVNGDGGKAITGAPLLDLVPDFHLDAITTELFGRDRLASYDLPFPAADRKLLAIEFHELGACILEDRSPEVDGEVGRRAVALCYAAFESSTQNRPVTLDEIESEAVGLYEAAINAQINL
ncbi:MAG: Gfo/Idh/MocA family protein [Anaerolineae bacterium]